MKRIHFILLSIFCLFLVACATTPTDPADMYKDQAPGKIFIDGQHAMLKGNYDEAVKRFEALDARYPFGKYARQSQLDLIYSYYQQDDTGSALAAVDRFIRLYPRGPDVDYAYYMRGLLRFYQNRSVFEKYFHTDFAMRDKTTLSGSFNDFNTLIHYFPKSRYAPDARQRMIYLRNLFARHELEVAQFYFKRDSYVAAANRANEVVRHYQQTPSVPDALAVMVKSYRKLNLPKAANNSLKVLKLNFPDSKAYKSLT